MLANETPSRVLRRIRDLEAQEDDMPTLPDLPSFSQDGDFEYTFQDQPSPKKQQQQDQLPTSKTNNILDGINRTGFGSAGKKDSYDKENRPSSNRSDTTAPITSTPAPSSYYRSISTSSNLSNKTTTSSHSNNRTISQNYPRPSSRNTVYSSTTITGDEQNNNADSVLDDDDELDRGLPSLDDGSGSIKQALSLDEMREDMVVVSSGSGSGTESEKNPTTEIGRARRRTLSPPGDDGERSIEQEGGEPVSARAKRLSLAEAQAHVSFRRRRPSSRRVTGEALRLANDPAQVEQVMENQNDEEEAVQSDEPELPSAFSPLRQTSPHSHNPIDDSSPGVGRHLATPLSSHHHSFTVPLSDIHDSPTPTHHETTVPIYATPFKAPNPDRTDAERRKEHLLQTLRSTQKSVRPKIRATPHPHRILGGGGGEEDDSVDSSSGTSNDLTTANRGNTSLPSGGVGEKSTRFNGAKLNAYLHSLNTHLTEENQTLVKTLGGTNKELKRLRKETKVLEDKIREMSVVQSTVGNSSNEVSREREEEIEKKFDGIVKSHAGIDALQRQLGDQLGSGTEGKRIGELEAQLERALATIADKDGEIDSLREKVLVKNNRDDDEEEHTDVQAQVFDLQDRLNEATTDLDNRSREVVQLREEFIDAGTKHENDIISLNEELDHLRVELEGKDAELDGARHDLESQEEEFADKMKRLEEELVRVMEEQEEQVESARKELETEKEEKDDNERKVAMLESDLVEVRKERDNLERRIATFGASHDTREEVDALREQISQLESLVAEKDNEIAKREEELEELEQKVDLLDADERRWEEQAEGLKQTEEALEESARQLIKNEDELEALRTALNSERTRAEGLAKQIQISSLHKTKSRSPLANEVHHDEEREAAISALEEELAVAQREVQDLRQKLENPTVTHATIEIKDLKIRQLEEQKIELETRVASLRSQQHGNSTFHFNANATPGKTPDKSVMFRSILGVQTPKTPGQFMSNLSAWSPGSTNPDATISPLLAQIHELELIVERLQQQLDEANGEIDSKLERLEAAGSSTISLARQLAEAQDRISRLEAELERLLGKNGTLERVRTRLSKIACPGCSATFDANRIVQLRIERRDVKYDGMSSSDTLHVNDSLRTALAGVNAKVTELKTENSVLQDAAARSKELADEKAKVVKQHAALQKDFAQARVEIATLESDLQTERTRLRTLANEQTLSNRAKSTLETRLATAEAELRSVKQDLNGKAGAGSQDRLRRERSGLVTERADLLRQLTEVNEHTSRVDSELDTTRARQADMESQLSRQIAEIQALRESLTSHEAQKRLLQDERGDILRGVAGLQADLQKVRQDAVSLGLDLAAVRRERNEMGARQGDDGAAVARLEDELAKARRKLGVFEQKVADHVCPSDANALAEMKARHSQEAKGLLVMIQYLKLRVTRESTFRADLTLQKEYLSALMREKQSTIDATMATLHQLGLPLIPHPRRTKLTFQTATKAVLAVSRMRLLTQRWRAQNVPKAKLRSQAYPDTRGRPFVP